MSQLRTRRSKKRPSPEAMETVNDENATPQTIGGAKRRSKRINDKKTLKEKNSINVDDSERMTAVVKVSPSNTYSENVPLSSFGNIRPFGPAVTASSIRQHWQATPSVLPPQSKLTFSEYTPQQENQLFGSPFAKISSPLPNLSWADSDKLWYLLRENETCKIAPESDLKQKHPGLTANMRAILFDWMMEVCEVYFIHRETYHMAIDLFDRYLDTQFGLTKDVLQRVGVTCLFTAAKIEEIYPPKVKEFAYVTDNACSAADMLTEELKICEALDWRLSKSFTINNWVNTFMQLGDNVSRTHAIPPVQRAASCCDFTQPKYSGNQFIQVMTLIDICTLDISSRQFSSSILAAAAIYHIINPTLELFTAMTGMEISDIQNCLAWLFPFYKVLKDGLPVQLKRFPEREVKENDRHNIQTHIINLQLLERVKYEREQMQRNAQYHKTPSVLFMTPPGGHNIPHPPRALNAFSQV